ncbi:MAG: type II toxin-antitoxin system Phd/YefM family antitoxin [Armatimonadetes bacterium]|nr:type II toxin-antitoxin system Phd/YefM family antitoxin [Armatimonadota bacterium]
MKTLTSRELRENTSQVWRDLPEQQQIVVTLNGRPVGVLTPTSAESLDADLRAIRRARAVQAVADMQAQSARNGLSDLGDDEVEAEIAAVRHGR